MVSMAALGLALLTTVHLAHCQQILMVCLAASNYQYPTFQPTLDQRTSCLFALDGGSEAGIRLDAVAVAVSPTRALDGDVEVSSSCVG